MIVNANCRGLRSVLRKFDEDGKYAEGEHWSIGKGGYDLWWELSYDGIPVVDCVCNRIKNLCLTNDLFNRIFRIVKEEYSDA